MRTTWRRLRAAWITLTGTGAAASVALGLLVFVAVLASIAIPRESTGLRNSALQRVIAAAPVAQRSVIATVSLSTLSPFGQLPARGLVGSGAALRSRLVAGGVRIASNPPAWASLTSGPVPVSGASPGRGHGPPQVELTYRTALSRYSRLVAGRLPPAAELNGPKAVVDVAVTTATAARLGLRVGDRLGTGPMRLAVTGIIQPVQPTSTFWTESPVAASPVLTPGLAPGSAYWSGAAFVGPGALPLMESELNPSLMQLTWMFPVSLGQLTADQAGTLRASVNGMVSSGGLVITPPARTPVAVTASSQIPAILTPFIAADDAVAPVLELLYVSLAVMGAVVVLLGARLVAERRAAELTLMRARGAAVRQLGWLVLRANAVIALAAGAAAALLAAGLTPDDGNPASWWLAGFTIAVTLAGPVLLIVTRHRKTAPAPNRLGARPRGRRPAARRIVVEAALIAASIGGLIVLRDQGLTGGNAALYPSTAPVLAAIPLAVIALRCYPWVARELARVAGRARGVVAFVGLARATRTPPGAGLPAFALVLVLAMVAFPAMISAAVTRGQVAASWQQVGADAIIEAPVNGAIPPSLQRQVAATPGVVATATGVIESASLSTSGETLDAVFVNPARYAAVADRAPGARFPLAALSASPHGGGVPAVATNGAARLLGRGPVQLNLGAQIITARVTGRIGGVAGLAGNVIAVLPQSAIGAGPSDANLMLVSGSRLDGARIRAAVGRELPGGSVTLRATALASLTGAPVTQAAQSALAQGIAAAAGFGVLVLLLSLVLGAQSRDMTLARLATMGLRRWQAQLLLATETFPQVVAAAIGGVGCAWLLAPLVGPSLNLAAFSGAPPGVGVTPASFPLAASAVGLVLAAMLALAAQAVITYRRGSTRALRIAD